MKHSVALLQQAPLFQGFTGEEIQILLPALSPRQHSFQKSEVLLWAGNETNEIGILLSGKLEAVKTTRAGSEFTVASLFRGDVFADVLAGGHTRSPVTVRATALGQVLYLNYPLLLGGGSHAGLRRRLLANLVGVLSSKYFALNARIDLLLTNGLRRRIAAYLLAEAARRNTTQFTIPYTRAGLAAYLGCERSALSRELSRMAKDGLLQTHRSHFALLQPKSLQQLLE
jgi:CRP-like cAMP-binding protein